MCLEVFNEGSVFCKLVTSPRLEKTKQMHISVHFMGSSLLVILHYWLAFHGWMFNSDVRLKDNLAETVPPACAETLTPVSSFGGWDSFAREPFHVSPVKLPVNEPRNQKCVSQPDGKVLKLWIFFSLQSSSCFWYLWVSTGLCFHVTVYSASSALPILATVFLVYLSFLTLQITI